MGIDVVQLSSMGDFNSSLIFDPWFSFTSHKIFLIVTPISQMFSNFRHFDSFLMREEYSIISLIILRTFALSHCAPKSPLIKAGCVHGAVTLIQWGHQIFPHQWARKFVSKKYFWMKLLRSRSDFIELITAIFINKFINCRDINCWIVQIHFWYC